MQRSCLEIPWNQSLFIVSARFVRICSSSVNGPNNLQTKLDIEIEIEIEKQNKLIRELEFGLFYVFDFYTRNDRLLRRLLSLGTKSE